MEFHKEEIKGCQGEGHQHQELCNIHPPEESQQSGWQHPTCMHNGSTFCEHNGYHAQQPAGQLPGNAKGSTERMSEDAPKRVAADITKKNLAYKRLTG